MSNEPEDNRGEIKITPEMIEAAAEVLWMHRMLDIPISLAEELAKEMLERGISSRGR